MQSQSLTTLPSLGTSLKVEFKVPKFRQNGKLGQPGSRIWPFIPLHEKLLQFDWVRAVVFQLNLKYLHVEITNLLRVVV